MAIYEHIYPYMSINGHKWPYGNMSSIYGHISLKMDCHPWRVRPNRLPQQLTLEIHQSPSGTSQGTSYKDTLPSMDHIWSIHGPCMDHICTTDGPYMTIYGPCMVHILIIFGPYVKHIYIYIYLYIYIYTYTI